MAHLLYYQREHDAVKAAFPALVESCTFADAKLLVEKLAAENGVVVRQVAATSGSRCSKWCPDNRWLILNTRALHWSTVIHEFGHALDEKLRPRSKRWHDNTLLELVLDLSRVVVERGWHLSIPAERAEREKREADQKAAREAAAAVRRAIENHPDNVRAKKIERRKIQIARLERKLKSLQTRLKSANRSLAALERSAARRNVVALREVKP